MRREITSFVLATGEVVGVLPAEEGEEAATVGEGRGWLEGDRVGDGWGRVDLATMEIVPLLQFECVVETNRLSNIPEGTRAFYMRQSDYIDDGELELVTHIVQTITVRLAHPLYEPASYGVPCEA